MHVVVPVVVGVMAGVGLVIVAVLVSEQFDRQLVPI